MSGGRANPGFRASFTVDDERKQSAETESNNDMEYNSMKQESVSGNKAEDTADRTSSEQQSNHKGLANGDSVTSLESGINIPNEGINGHQNGHISSTVQQKELDHTEVTIDDGRCAVTFSAASNGGVASASAEFGSGIGLSCGDS